MYIDPVLTITHQQAEIQRAMVEAERRRVAAERRAADKDEGRLQKSANRTPIRCFFRKTVNS